MMIKHSQYKNERNEKSTSQNEFNLFKTQFDCSRIIYLIYSRESKGETPSKGKGKGKGKQKFRSGAKKPKAGAGQRDPKKRFGGRKRR